MLGTFPFLLQTYYLLQHNPTCIYKKPITMLKRSRRKVSDSTRFKMSIAKQGRKNPMFGRHHSQTSKQRISKSMKKYWDNLNDWDTFIY